MADREFKGLYFEFETKSADNSDVGEFVGVASTSEKDLQDDIIEPFAFGSNINCRSIPLLRDHDPRSVIGGWKSIEYNEGGSRLKVHGEISLSDSIPKGRETFELLKRGWISGLSVGFRILNPEKNVVIDEVKRVRRIKQALLLEASIVSIPANPGARAKVKSFSPAELRGWLAEAGFDSSDIAVLMTRGFDALSGHQPDAVRQRQLIREIDGHAPQDAWQTLDSSVRGLLADLKRNLGHVVS